MTRSLHVDSEKLIAEIGRYLAAVELFRTLGHEPRWLPETIRPGARPSERLSTVAADNRAH